MMTSVGGNRARSNWDQTQGQTQSQTQHKQRPQATAEQIRLAQMISDHNDADFEEKVKQLIDITGKDQDESMIALHDCNGDVNRAINVLLEGSPDTDSWEMVGKKKSLSGPKESIQADTGEDGKENRDKGGERDVARRRGGAPRRGRGASRGREFRGQENGLDSSKVAGIAGRGMERGRRGRGRGRGALDGSLLPGPALAGRRGGRFSAQGMGQIDKEARYDFAGDTRTFNPADYTEPAQTDESYGGGSTWNSTGGAEPDDGARSELTPGEAANYQPKFDSTPGPWRSATEEWGTEDWNEDLSETKIFTASNVAVAAAPPPQENVTITKGQRIDLAVLLGKTPPAASSEAEAAPQEAGPPASLNQSLVFSNSKQGVPLSPAAPGAPYSQQHSMVNMLSKGFGDVGGPKGGSTGTTTGSQFLEQYKTAQALAQLAAQHSQVAPPGASPSSWDTGASALGQYEAKPEPAAHSPFTKRQPYQATAATSSMLDAFLPSAPSPHAVPPPASCLPKMTGPPSSSSSLGQQQASPGSSDTQGSSPLPLQQHKLKQQKKRTSITTKIPAMAVEMPGSSDISGLHLQFGALQFGTEPVLQEYDSNPTAAAAAPSHQAQSSLYAAPSSESGPGLPSPTQMEMYEQRASQTRRYPSSVSSSPQKDMQPNNGFHSMQTGPSGDAAGGSAASGKLVSEAHTTASASSMGTLTDTGPTSLMTTANQMAHAALGHSEELTQSSVSQPQHINSLSSQQGGHPQSSGRTGNPSLMQHQGMDGDGGLHSSSSYASSSAPSSYSVASSTHVALGAMPQVLSMGATTISAPSGLGPVSSLAMGLNAASMCQPMGGVGPGAVSIAPPASAIASSLRGSVSSGKAPPNLPPGVPPLLPNPYIMAPGLLHAYPVYGYDDLQMLQARIPLDYYSIPFAAPTNALTGRDGNLNNNPYSGDLSKFGRADTSSPAPATTMAQSQQNQSQTHHTAQQTFLNPALPPGYSYTSLPYYTGMPGLPNTFQYGPAVFPVAPTSSKQHPVNVGVNASATPFQQAGGYGSHGYSTGYEDVGQASGSGDFCKGGYGTVAAAAASAQIKPATSVTGPGVGVSVTSSNTGVPDISGSVYTKTQQSFDKQGFHAGTPTASFSLPSALGSGGPINPPAPAGYPQAPFMHILAPHQQQHSQILHHHLQQEAQTGTGQRSQNASLQQKAQINKSAYNSYNWGGN
ncbi:ubiquitin-associated protein 2-like isoform X4 [Gadus chalcogrammus]|uniref:ubiquitin-associated protein 2-like isoform X4 n=1 Tax=Gadus chalcogrammus TaxID=1042646 RepID=UPI0024C4E1E6|nr:ubiquitin-associated protein 2-like isoform X4 [Gadus chalcogrammus]